MLKKRRKKGNGRVCCGVGRKGKVFCEEEKRKEEKRREKKTSRYIYQGQSTSQKETRPVHPPHSPSLCVTILPRVEVSSKSIRTLIPTEVYKHIHRGEGGRDKRKQREEKCSQLFHYFRLILVFSSQFHQLLQRRERQNGKKEKGRQMTTKP